jgi:hypothetical protein
MEGVPSRQGKLRARIALEMELDALGIRQAPRCLLSCWPWVMWAEIAL